MKTAKQKDLLNLNSAVEAGRGEGEPQMDNYSTMRKRLPLKGGTKEVIETVGSLLLTGIFCVPSVDHNSTMANPGKAVLVMARGAGAV